MRKRKHEGKKKRKHIPSSDDSSPSSDMDSTNDSEDDTSPLSDSDSSTHHNKRKCRKLKEAKEEIDSLKRKLKQAEKKYEDLEDSLCKHKHKSKQSSKDPAASVHHCPDKSKGIIAPAIQAQIPCATQKIMESGWKEHLLLTILTNTFCESHNATRPEPETAQIDDNGKLVFKTRIPQTCCNETSLDLAEWLQAWDRLSKLINTYFPRQLQAWCAHFTCIMGHADWDKKWLVLLCYDIELRHCSTNSSINILIWQEEIYKHQEDLFRNKQLNALAGPSTFTPPAPPAHAPPNWLPLMNTKPSANPLKPPTHPISICP
ncbi:polyprotein [Ceratobasidium theobromae]|uniref:Polyprotein n=1 Tax=Ceratobasidium theobromae TaxID=1582974 RepID=A0A5N5Q7Q9_9AGAM|nr:polyprotein [Ceratobasidium theobromae]